MADKKEETVAPKTHIIMRVDAPPEDKNNVSPPEVMENSVEHKIDGAQSHTSTKSKSTSALSSSNPFAMRSSILGSPKQYTGLVLRPSQLGTKVENKTESKSHQFSLNPSRLNPLGKPESSSADELEKSPKNDKSNMSEPTKPIEISNNSTSTSETPKFVPLVISESSRSDTLTNSATSTPNFVFGQNLHERVIAENENTDLNSAQPVASTSCTNANGTSELLFSNAMSKPVESDPTKEVKSLSESAREYEESRANKRKYEEVAVVTGEEDEKNLMQINCKLFAFDKATGNWQERGRGTLRLNDKEMVGENNCENFVQSRLVFRTSGSLRVVLNTKIWAEMTIDHASPKSLRLTAMDSSGQIKVFLIMATSEEIKQLQRLLEARVQNEIERHKQHKISKSEPDSKKQAVDSSD